MFVRKFYKRTQMPTQQTPIQTLSQTPLSTSHTSFNKFRMDTCQVRFPLKVASCFENHQQQEINVASMCHHQKQGASSPVASENASYSQQKFPLLWLVFVVALPLVK